LIMIVSILFRTSNTFSASALISEKCVPKLMKQYRRHIINVSGCILEVSVV